MFLMFCCTHQGGVIPSLLYLQTRIIDARVRGDLGETHTHTIESETAECSVHIVYHRTYMPPRHLLLIPASNSVKEGETGVRVVRVSDWAGLGREERNRRVESLLAER